MKKEELLLIGCGILKKEITFLIKKNNWPVESLFLDSSLHIDFEKLENSLTSVLARKSDQPTIVFYGSCHPLMEELLDKTKTMRTPGQNCAEILLGSYRFTEELAAGAFFLLEDWAKRWDFIIGKTFGTNREVVKDIFKGDRKYLLCLRTPCSVDFSEQALAAGRLVDLPTKWMDVPLDHLEKALDELIRKRLKELSIAKKSDAEKRISNLENRLAKLAQEKSYIQLMADLMNKLSSVSGLENIVENMLGIVMEHIGGSNVSIYYKIDEYYFYVNVFGEKKKMTSISDEDVRKVFETRENIENVGNFLNTKMTTPEFSNSYTWVFPLMVGNDIVGVFKIEDIIISAQEVQQQLNLFFNYAALILKNEILGYTRLQAAYEKLMESENRYSMTLSAVNDGFWDWNVPSGQAFFSPLYYSMLGYRNEEFPASYSTWRPLVHPEDVGRVERELQEGIQNSKGFSIDLRMKMKSGDFLWVSTRGKAVEKDQDGNAIRMLGTLSDITERKRSETLLLKSESELKELNATKDKFFSIIAHDLKAPFSTIFGFTDFLIRDFGDMDQQEISKLLKRIGDASKQAYQLLDNLLIWANSQTGNIVFNPEAIHLRKRIMEVINLLEGKASQKNIRLSADISDEMIIDADKNMFDTIIRNLLSNAIKFTPRGGLVTASVIRQNGEVEISITDTGVGIDDKQLSSIFKVGANLSSPGTEKEKGTGLGLILCREFVEKHGGSIRVESQKGKGSTFSFRLPV